jgi:hypothetical protein
MHVVLHGKREGIVDHILHLRNIQASSSYIGGYQQRYPTGLELFQCCRAVMLRLILSDALLHTIR